MISTFISKDKSVKGTRSWLCDFRISSYLKGLGQDLTSNLKKKNHASMFRMVNIMFFLILCQHLKVKY